ncbi:MAG TPA: hypothetical protein DHU56_14175 [Marinobacter sp.]|nr:hypothetical protein [Marinobacter sp.]
MFVNLYFPGNFFSGQKNPVKTGLKASAVLEGGSKGFIRQLPDLTNPFYRSGIKSLWPHNYVLFSYWTGSLKSGRLQYPVWLITRRGTRLHALNLRNSVEEEVRYKFHQETDHEPQDTD